MQTPNPARIVTAGHDAIATALVRTALDRIRNHTKPWQSMTEAEQTRVIDDVKQTVDRAVRDAINVIAGAERPVIRAVVEQVVFKDGIKAVLVAERDNAERHALADAQGQTVLVVVREGMDDYAAGMDEIRAEADQRTLPLDDSLDAEFEEDEDGVDIRPGNYDAKLAQWCAAAGLPRPLTTEAMQHWSAEARALVLEWLQAAVAHASDPSVTVPERPAVLDPYLIPLDGDPPPAAPALEVDDVVTALEQVDGIETPGPQDIEDWTDEQRIGAYEWARRVLLAAGDESADVPERPAHLGEWVQTPIGIRCKADVTAPDTGDVVFIAGETYRAARLPEGAIFATGKNGRRWQLRPGDDADVSTHWFDAHFTTCDPPEAPAAAQASGKGKGRGKRKGNGAEGAGAAA